MSGEIKKKEHEVFLTYFNKNGSLVKTCSVFWEIRTLYSVPNMNDVKSKVRGLRDSGARLPEMEQDWDGYVLIEAENSSAKVLLLPSDLDRKEFN